MLRLCAFGNGGPAAASTEMCMTSVTIVGVNGIRSEGDDRLVV